MTIADALIRDGKFISSAIDTCSSDAATVIAALQAETLPERQAALAIVAGQQRFTQAASALLPLLSCDGIAGRAAAWALARIASPAIEQAVCKAITDGNLDQRDNGYWCLATLASLGAASPALADAMAVRVEVENAKAKSGGSSLADHAVRILAVMGDKRTDALAEAAMEADRFCDRFELNRLRKAVADRGRDNDTIHERSALWTIIFSNHLAAEIKTETKAVTPPAAASAAAPAMKTAGPSAAQKPQDMASEQNPEAMQADDTMADDGAELPPTQGKPIDWPAFAASPEAAALPAPHRQMTEQLGKMLEQLATRAVGVPLTDLGGQELAALLLQVLPQALPPQHVQTALSPQALNGYQALMQFLHNTGAATSGAELVEAIKLVRKQMREQMRRAGILGGPDYSEPEEKKPLAQ